MSIRINRSLNREERSRGRAEYWPFTAGYAVEPETSDPMLVAIEGWDHTAMPTYILKVVEGWEGTP